MTDDTLIRDLPLGNRARNALCYSYGTDAWKPKYNPDRTFGEIKGLSDYELLRLPNFGQASLREWKMVRDMMLNFDRKADALQRRMELHSLLLAHESAVIALYDAQRADPEEFTGLDVDLSINKRQARVARVREEILAYVEQQS